MLGMEEIIAQSDCDEQSSIVMVNNHSLPEETRLGHLKCLGQYRTDEVKTVIEQVANSWPIISRYSKRMRSVAKSILEANYQ